MSFPYVQVALHANSALKETKAQLEGEVTRLNYTMRDREGRYEQEVMKLQVRRARMYIIHPLIGTYMYDTKQEKLLICETFSNTKVRST